MFPVPLARKRVFGQICPNLVKFAQIWQKLHLLCICFMSISPLLIRKRALFAVGPPRDPRKCPPRGVAQVRGCSHAVHLFTLHLFTLRLFTPHSFTHRLHTSSLHTSHLHTLTLHTLTLHTSPRVATWPFGDRARCACICSLSPTTGRWPGGSEIARDAHACARFPHSMWALGHALSSAPPVGMPRSRVASPPRS